MPRLRVDFLKRVKSQNYGSGRPTEYQSADLGELPKISSNSWLAVHVSCTPPFWPQLRNASKVNLPEFDAPLPRTDNRQLRSRATRHRHVFCLVYISAYERPMNAISMASMTSATVQWSHFALDPIAASNSKNIARRGRVRPRVPANTARPASSCRCHH